MPALTDKALLRYRAGDDEAGMAGGAPGARDGYVRSGGELLLRPESHVRSARLADARDGFEVAAQSVEYRAAALVQLARLVAPGRAAPRRQGIRRAQRRSRPRELEARQVLALAYRLAGRAADGRTRS